MIPGNMKVILVIAIANLCQQVLGQGTSVTLYADSDYNGRSIVVNIGNCENVMSRNFNDMATSVRTSVCVRLWEHADCTGRSVDVQPPGINNLGNLRFNDKLTSLSECKLFGGVSDDVDIRVDTSEATDLAAYGERAKTLMRKWFPFIQNMLSTPSYKPVTIINVKFPREDRGIFASGNYIEVPAQYLRNNPNDWGVFIHEMTHVIQQGWGVDCPGWIVEGTAEYMRRWYFEPKTTRKPSKGTSMENPYIGDWLLVYLNTKNEIGKPIFYELTKACQDGGWYNGIVRDLTGKNENEWWDIMLNDDSFPFKRI